MNAMLSNRDSSSVPPGTCDPGYSFYRCDGGWVGCCGVDPCDNPSCPLDERQPTHTTSSTFTSTTDAPDTSSTAKIDPESTSGETNVGAGLPTSTIFPLPPTSSSSSLSLASSSSPSSFLPTQTTSADTTTPTSNPTPGDAASLSTAAIIGISIGGTVALMLALLIGGLLVRRCWIARRYAAADAVTLPGPYAEYMDTPDRSAPWKGVSELP